MHPAVIWERNSNLSGQRRKIEKFFSDLFT